LMSISGQLVERDWRPLGMLCMVRLSVFVSLFSTSAILCLLHLLHFATFTLHEFHPSLTCEFTSGLSHRFPNGLRQPRRHRRIRTFTHNPPLGRSERLSFAEYHRCCCCSLYVLSPLAMYLCSSTFFHPVVYPALPTRSSSLRP
jgi:hypothetical protein